MKKPPRLLKFNPSLDSFAHLFIFSVSVFLMFSTFHSRPGELIIASKLWSDFGAHIPLIRSFSLGDNFPNIQYPTFPGEPIRYHFLFYLIVGLFERLGVNLGLALNSLSALGFGLLLYLIYRITKLVSSSSTGALISLFLFLLNGSLSFLNFFKDHPLSPRTLSDLLSLHQFPSFAPWDDQVIAAFWNLNIYTNQRHLALSFAFSLLLLWPLINFIYTRSKPTLTYLLMIASLMLFLPYLNQAAFAIILITLPTLYLLNFPHTKSIFSYLVLVLFFSLPGIIRILSLQGSSLAFEPGFLSETQNVLSLLSYWFLNLGVYLPLFPLLLLTADKKGKTLLLSALPLFIMANLFRFSPDMINNHKLINFFQIFLVIFTASFLIKVWRRHTFLKPLVLILGFFLTLSGLIDLFPILNDQKIAVADLPLDSTASWIDSHTPPRAIFLTTTHLYNPASLAGRFTWLDYGYFNWSLGYDESHRRQLLPELFSSTISPQTLCSHFHREQIDYILIDPTTHDVGGRDPQFSVIRLQFTPTYQLENGYHIYNTKDNCPTL